MRKRIPRSSFLIPCSSSFLASGKNSEISLRPYLQPSLGPHRDQWVDAASPSSREEGCEEGEGDEGKGAHCERYRVCRCHAEQKPADKRRYKKRQQQTDERAVARELNAVAHHKPDDSAPIGAKR